ncbi:CYTH domain-containing protein [Rhizobiales bacterium RZME27]|jgi:CYTH domain-containing protein|uniref:CYTH domain-containing protein n=1 Tax=Endobacterium cereale TaxID=2663029 RepID=A0A6A8ACA9_9HYPH|nr:CYTH domain-containing protein [Endobacterium cereale]MEB2845580.1 CYTH domain-containing protein [Endobacterium cereale]MQY48792.1 CYTH domain-containing protein [Endobacterium cereale]
MAKEIERKFLVADDGWKAGVGTTSKFLQAYIATGEDRSIRVRIIDGERARLTIKLGRDLLVRDEFEYDIPVADAEELMQAAIGIVLEKSRHRVDYRGFTFEVDEFAGFYHGLIVAEVEMRSTEDRPDLPAWLGREVTGDKRYSNMAMATNEDLSAELGHGLSNPPL